MTDGECIECGHSHTLPGYRCPACQGVRDYHRMRLQNMLPGLPFSETAFSVAYGPEAPIRALTTVGE